MSIAEFVEQELSGNGTRLLNFTQRLPVSDYLDGKKTYNLEVCADKGTEHSYGWSLTNPYSTDFCPVHQKTASMISPKVTLEPSADTKSCSVTVDPDNLFKTAGSITIFVWAEEHHSSAFASSVVGGIIETGNRLHFGNLAYSSVLEHFVRAFLGENIGILASCIIVRIPVTVLDRIICTFAGYGIYMLFNKEKPHAE